MSFCLGWGESEINSAGMLYFDAVVSYSSSHTGATTKHPVDGGSNITDFYISNNPTYNLSCVISADDISTNTYILSTEEGVSPSNVTKAPTAVSIGSSDKSLLGQFIPSVIAQLIPDHSPDVIVDDFKGDIFSGSVDGIREQLIRLQSGEGVNAQGQFVAIIQPVTLYETSGLTLTKKIPSIDSKYLVVTSISFKEDPDSGSGLYFDMTLEEVRFTNLKKVAIPPELVQKPVQKKATTKKSLGKCDSTTKDTATSTDKGTSGAVDDAQSDVDPERNVAGEI